MPNKTTLLDRVRIQPIATEDDLNAIVVEAARLEMERDKTIIERDEKIQEISEPFNMQIKAFDDELEMITKRLHAWSKKNRKEQFKDKKSILVLGHKLAFRDSPGKVAYLPGIKAADAKENILSTDDEKDVLRFTNISANIAKDPLIKAWDAGEKDLIRSFGIEIIKPELFSFTPNREEMPDIAIQSSKL